MLLSRELKRQKIKCYLPEVPPFLDSDGGIGDYNSLFLRLSALPMSDYNLTPCDDGDVGGGNTFSDMFLSVWEIFIASTVARCKP